MRIVLTLMLVALLAGCAAIDRWSGVSQAKELEKNGESAQAEILKIWDTGMTVNNDPVVGFDLQVRPEGKPSYDTQTKLRIPRLSISQVQPATVVPVRIDRRNPNRVSLDIYDFQDDKEKKKGSSKD
jgi:hypothetical protein